MPQTIDNLLATWNNAAQTFTAFKFSITDTASSAASLLMDLQVGGTSRFSVSKAGRITAVGIDAGLAGNSPSYIARLCIAGNDDVWLTRRGANNLRFGQADAAAPVAQTLSVQSVVAGTSNTAGTDFTIAGSQGTGTGAGGSIVFQVAPAGSSGTAQNALTTALTINSAGNTLLSGTLALGGSATATVFKQATSDYIEAGTGFSMGAGTSAGCSMQSGGFIVGPQATISFGNANGVGARDVILARDAANTLAQRNGTNAQRFNLYNSYTDASNYSRMTFGTSGAGGFEVTSQKGGTGTLASLRLRVEGLQNIWFDTNSTTRMFIDYDGSLGFGNNATGDNTYDIGATIYGLRRPRDVYIGRNLVQAGAYHEIAEMTAPAAPAADGVRIYAEDNGSGKTRLMARFATGAAVQIAIEP